MARGFLISDGLHKDIKRTIARVDGMPDGPGATKIPTRFETIPQAASRPRFFKLNQDLNPCESALGDEVRIVKGDSCGVEVEPVPGPPSGSGKRDIELFDVSQCVRAYNLAKDASDIDSPAPAGSVVEAAIQFQTEENDDGTKYFWRILRFIECECGSSSSSESSSESKSQSDSSSSSGSGSIGSESEKSTAIVPASWTPGGYTALFVEESPEVRFDDVIEVTVQQEYCCVPLDPRFVEVCERGTIRVCGCVPDKPVLVGTSVEDSTIAIQFDRNRPKSSVTLVIRVTGIRRGFKGLRFPSRSRRQFVANERFINSAYPAE